jgi:hypothetical protein
MTMARSTPPAETATSPAETVVEITVDSVFSSLGEHLRGEKPSIPTADAEILIANGQAKRA